MPTKTWTDGDIPSGADFNTYFRDQVITTCTSGARPTTTVDGRMIYETDTTRYYRWSTASSSWVMALGPASHNYVINGNFAIAHRGLGPFTSPYPSGTVDQWKVATSGSTFSTTLTSMTPGGIPGVQEGGWYLRTVTASVAGAGNYVLLRHMIEDVRTLAGQTVTVSFYAKADAARPVSIEFEQYFGTGGSPSAAVDTFVAKKTLSTTWTRYEASVTVPSITGKTLGTTGGHALTLYIWLDAGTTYSSRTSSLGQQSGTFDFAMVQVEAGASATPFEVETYQVTFAKCRRFLTVIPAATVTGSMTSAANAFFSAPLDVPMRAFPTVSFGPLSNVIADQPAGVFRTPTAVSVYTADIYRLVFTSSGATSQTVNGLCTWQAPITLDAEL